jgi:hypothetical protein
MQKFKVPFKDAYRKNEAAHHTMGDLYFHNPLFGKEMGCTEGPTRNEVLPGRLLLGFEAAPDARARKQAARLGGEKRAPFYWLQFHDASSIHSQPNQNVPYHGPLTKIPPSAVEPLPQVNFNFQPPH